MTESHAAAEPDVREFRATVEHVDGREVVLNETYFYPESGGQPADRGTLEGVLLADVVEVDGEVVHVCSAEVDADVGDTVTGVIDDAFRTYCMRAHTASHVLYGAARRICDGLGYAGFDISPEKVRVDLTAEDPLDDGDLVELERLSNRAVWESRPVTWETMSVADARALDGIAFNEKTEDGAMGGRDEAGVDDRSDAAGAAGNGGGEHAVRVVTVEGWDTAACGGTHVRNTAEIGPITTLGRSNPGEGITRVEFAVGPTAIDHSACVHAAALEATTALDTNVEGLVGAVDRLANDVERLEGELRDATESLNASRLRDLPRTEIDGRDWAIGVVADAEPNDLRGPAEAIVGGGDGGAERDGADRPDVIAAVGSGPAPFLVVAVGDGSGGDSTGDGSGVDSTVGGSGDSAVPVHAGDVVESVTDEFGGGGGGGATFAQGGGLDVDPETVVEWLNTR